MNRRRYNYNQSTETYLEGVRELGHGLLDVHRRLVHAHKHTHVEVNAA